MKLPLAVKLALGVASFIPLAYVLGMLVKAALVASDQTTFLSVDDIMRESSVDPWQIAVLALTYLLAAFYIVYLRRISLPEGLKPLWWVALFGVPPVALPVFWFNYVQPGDKRDF